MPSELVLMNHFAESALICAHRARKVVKSSLRPADAADGEGVEDTARQRDSAKGAQMRSEAFQGLQAGRAQRAEIGIKDARPTQDARLREEHGLTDLTQEVNWPHALYNAPVQKTAKPRMCDKDAHAPRGWPPVILLAAYCAGGPAEVVNRKSRYCRVFVRTRRRDRSRSAIAVPLRPVPDRRGKGEPKGPLPIA
jgi:hypothetical protein